MKHTSSILRIFIALIFLSLLFAGFALTVDAVGKSYPNQSKMNLM